MTVGIVSGYFAPLHEGHLDYLHAAKELVDFLIVIVNNDKQLYNKKGFIPIDENTRVAIIKELRCVDGVILSIDTDESVRRTIQEIQRSEPFRQDNILIINDADGSDREADIPGVTYITLHNKKKNSSSAIIERIKENA